MMEASPGRRAGTPRHQEYDLLTIPENISQLAVKRGDEGMIEDLTLRNNTVVACVKIYHSTRQPKGLVEMRIRPAQQTVSCFPVARGGVFFAGKPWFKLLDPGSRS